jgi:hypothetical protein
MSRGENVYVSESSLKTHHPTFHQGVGFNQMRGILMKCDPRHLCEFDCIELPRRHAEKFATPCLNCFRESRV